MARYTGPATRISRRLNVDLVGGDSSFERRLQLSLDHEERVDTDVVT